MCAKNALVEIPPPPVMLPLRVAARTHTRANLRGCRVDLDDHRCRRFVWRLPPLCERCVLWRLPPPDKHRALPVVRRFSPLCQRVVFQKEAGIERRRLGEADDHWVQNPRRCVHLVEWRLEACQQKSRPDNASSPARSRSGCHALENAVRVLMVHGFAGASSMCFLPRLSRLLRLPLLNLHLLRLCLLHLQQ